MDYSGFMALYTGPKIEYNGIKLLSNRIKPE
jgi:hypothetical protein